MQPRNTAVLFAIAVLLGAFVYLYEIQGEAGREDANAESLRIFPGVEAEAIDVLEFRTQDDRAFLSVRVDAGWEIQTPVSFPGDEVGLDAIASTLANLKSEETIASAGAPEIYGLGESAKLIQFRVGEQHYTLEIGADTPVGGSVYVRNPAQSDLESVYSVARFRVDSFARDLDALRDRRVLRFDRTKVNRVVAGWPGGSVTLEKTEAGWAIANPKEMSGPADAKTVDDLLSDVAFLRALGFKDLADTGGAVTKADGEPYYSLRLGLSEPDPYDHEGNSQSDGHPLEVGFQVLSDTGEEEYLVSAGHPGVLFSVPRSRIDGFPRELFAFRFKELSEFETKDVQSFDLIFNAPGEANSVKPLTVRVDRVATGWKSAGAGEGLGVDEEWVVGAAAGLVAEFARLEAVSVVEEVAGANTLGALGLQPPSTILRAYGAPTASDPTEVAGADAKVGVVSAPRVLLAEVSLGALDPVAGIAAKAFGQAAIYRLDPALAEQLPLGLEDFRARFLLPAVEDSAAE